MSLWTVYFYLFYLIFFFFSLIFSFFIYFSLSRSRVFPTKVGDPRRVVAPTTKKDLPPSEVTSFRSFPLFPVQSPFSFVPPDRRQHRVLRFERSVDKPLTQASLDVTSGVFGGQDIFEFKLRIGKVGEQTYITVLKFAFLFFSFFLFSPIFSFLPFFSFLISCLCPSSDL